MAEHMNRVIPGIILDSLMNVAGTTRRPLPVVLTAASTVIWNSQHNTKANTQFIQEGRYLTFFPIKVSTE